MNSSNYKLSLDVQQACSPVVLEGKLGDTRRTLWISLTDGSVPYIIAGECYAVFTAAKPDGTFIANPCRILGNTIVYDLTPQTLAAAGYCDCEIRLYGADDGLLTSARFGLLVHEPALGDEDVIQSETEVNALTQLIGDAAQVIRESELQNLESRVLIGELELHRQDFEQKAVDARADAKAAELSAQVAESSAREAGRSQQAAALSEQGAQFHRQAAELSAKVAEGSAQAAGLSQQAAALSEQGAQFHRQAAEDASDEAQLALQMAIQSQSGAEYWAGQAKKHAQEAAQNGGGGGGINLDALDQRIEDAILEHSEGDVQSHPDIRKHLDALDQRFGDLEQLETEDKSSLVAAVNEVLGKVGTGGSGGNANCLLTIETITIGEPGEPGNIPVTGITLDYSTISLDVGDSMMLAASVTPNNATNKLVLWESSNTNIATVNNGYVTAVSEGNAVITAKSAENNSIKATCSVAVAAETGGDEPGGETGEKIYFGEWASSAPGMLKKKDGTDYNIGTGKTNGYLQLPYSEGMFISTYHNGAFIGNYPAILVDDNGTYTVVETENTILGGAMTVYTATLTGFSGSAIVYVNTSTFGCPGYVIEDYMYYIPGGVE